MRIESHSRVNQPADKANSIVFTLSVLYFICVVKFSSDFLMASNTDHLEDMEFELKFKMYKNFVVLPDRFNVTYAGQQVEWQLKLNYVNGKTQFNLLLHEDLAFADEKPLRVKRFNIFVEKQKKMPRTLDGDADIEYTYSGGVFQFEPWRYSTEDGYKIEKNYEVDFKFLLDKAVFPSARNSVVTPFPDYTYIIKWNLNEDLKRKLITNSESRHARFTYRLKPIRWQLKLRFFTNAYLFCKNQMFRITLYTPDNIPFNRNDPILKSTLQFFRGDQRLLMTSDDSYSWDGHTCSFVTPYETSKLLTSGDDKLKVQLDVTVNNSDPKNTELPSRSSESASCSSIAEIGHKYDTMTKNKIDSQIANLRKNIAMVSEYNYVLKWDSSTLPTDFSPPLQVTYCRNLITWNMKLVSFSKKDKQLVKFTLRSSHKIQFLQNDPILSSSLIIMCDGHLLVSKNNDLYTWKDFTFEFQTTYDTVEWRTSGNYKIHFDFTLESSKQQNLESTVSPEPASSASDPFEIINQEQSSDDRSFSSIELIPINEATTPIPSNTQESTPNSKNSTIKAQLSSKDVSNSALSSSINDQCSPTRSIEEIPADIELAAPITATSHELPSPETKNDFLTKHFIKHKDKTLAEDFQRLFETSTNYDTVINLVFKVHRSVLAIRSPEFNRLINEEKTNDTAGVLKLTINDVNYEDMRAMLNYIYNVVGSILSSDDSISRTIRVDWTYEVV